MGCGDGLWGWVVGMGGERRHSGGFKLRIMPPPWHSVPALRNNDLPQAGHLPARRCRRNCSSLLRRLLQTELIYFAATKIRIGRGNVAATTSQAGHSFLRHDGAAAIPDFRPRIENRCSHKVKTRAIRASILDFRPRLANRCSHKVKAGAIRALILDFKPRLANRCSQEVKTEAISPAQGRTALCRGRGMPDGQGLRTA